MIKNKIHKKKKKGHYVAVSLEEKTHENSQSGGRDTSQDLRR